MATSFEQSIQAAYFASPEALGALEHEFIAETSSLFPGALGAVILNSPDVGGRYGTIARTLEVAVGFTDMPATSAAIELASSFLFIVDKDADADRYITHATRLIQPTGADSIASVYEIESTLDGQVTLEEAMSHHKISNIEKCIFVSTDLAVPGVMPTRTKPYGLLAYKALLNHGEQQEATLILAYMNKHTLRALGRLGITHEPLCGRTDYSIPPMGGMTFEAYQPYVITGDDHNYRIFRDSEYAAGLRSMWGAVVAKIDLPMIYLNDVS